MINGLSKAIILYLTPLLMLTTVALTLIAYLAPVLAFHDQVALLTVLPSTTLVQSGPAQDIDGPSVFMGPLGSCSRPNKATPINCISPSFSPIYDVSVLPKESPSILLTAPTPSTPAFIAVGIVFSAIYFILFILVTFRHKFPEKLATSLDKPILPRVAAWFGFFGFMTGLTSLVILRMWFGKTVQDFNRFIQAQGAKGPKLIASEGNAFTMIWVAYAFYAIPLIVSLTKMNVTVKK